MAAKLGRSPDEVRQFIAMHSAGGRGVGNGGEAPPPADGSPAPSDDPTAAPFNELMRGLIDGKLDRDAAAELARQVVSGGQRQAAAANGGFINPGGLTW